MKLLNQSVLYLSLPILILISIWSFTFYSNMFNEIYDSIDDGLDNYKLLIIQKSEKDSLVFRKQSFDEGNYAIRPISKLLALTHGDQYQDTLMYMLNEEELEPVRMLTTTFQHQDSFYQLKVISSMVEEDDQIANLSRAALWLYISLLLSIVLINNVVLKKLWKPFYELLDKLKLFRLGKDYGLPPLNTNTYEFKELKNAADVLIKHSVDAYNNQRWFIENAAHELQTPLATITTKLELLAENTSLPAEAAQVIEQIMNTTSRLTKLNRSLLLLSKIENKQFSANHSVSINGLVQQITNELTEYAAYKEISLAIESSAEVNVKMDDHLAYILVMNLVKNAVFHSPKEGKIFIHLTSHKLLITNTARSGALDGKVIFKRFHSSSKNKGGSGLGLPIARAICELFSFEISYQHLAQVHAFEVDFHPAPQH